MCEVDNTCLSLFNLFEYSSHKLAIMDTLDDINAEFKQPEVFGVRHFTTRKYIVAMIRLVDLYYNLHRNHLMFKDICW